jgi:hypothetical protein
VRFQAPAAVCSMFSPFWDVHQPTPRNIPALRVSCLSAGPVYVKSVEYNVQDSHLCYVRDCRLIKSKELVIHGRVTRPLYHILQRSVIREFRLPPRSSCELRCCRLKRRK